MKKTNIIIYVGTCTIKAYIENMCIHTKSMQDLVGIEISSVQYAANLYNNVLSFIEELKQNSENLKIEIFASSIFRDLYAGNFIVFVNSFYNKTHNYFNILEKHIELKYLKNSLKIKGDVPYFVLNIGGQIFELHYFCKNMHKFIQHKLGTSNLIKEFQLIKDNSPISQKQLTEILHWIKGDIKNNIFEFFNSYGAAHDIYYVSGELNFIKKIGGEDIIKKDGRISFSDYECLIKEFCTEKELSGIAGFEDNAKWLEGSRACSLIALSIFNDMSSCYFIPRDEDISDGIIAQKYFLMLVLANQESEEFNNIITDNERNGTICIKILSKENSLDINTIYNYITICDVIYIFNNYTEDYLLYILLGYAFTLNKKVIFHIKPDSNILDRFPIEYIKN